METTILTLPMRPARLAAGVLLSCVLAPAQAHQPVSRHLPALCASGKSCPAPGTDTRPHTSTRQTPECARLRAAIVESEQSERQLRAAMMESVQQDLLILRKRYRKLGCRAGA